MSDKRARQIIDIANTQKPCGADDHWTWGFISGAEWADNNPTDEIFKNIEYEAINFNLNEILKSAAICLSHLQRELNNKQTIEPDGPNHKFISSTLELMSQMRW